MIHQRITQCHPEITSEDVLVAFRSLMVSARRADGYFIGIGLDARGRNIELVYAARGEEFLVFHAFTPPTKKFLREIERKEK